MIRTFFVSLLIGSISLAQEPNAKPAPTKLNPEITAALEAHPGLVYARYDQREMQLDLWRPKNAAPPLPAIICIHGGGWYKGERSSMANLAQALAAKGFVAATISYRLSGEAKFPAAMQDCKAAVRFLRANAAKFGRYSAAPSRSPFRWKSPACCATRSGRENP